MGKIMSKLKTLLKKEETTIDNSCNEVKEHIEEELEIFDIADEENIETINVTEIIETNDKKINNETIILTRIYCDDITLEEIENYDLAEFNKEVLKIAYYDKQKRYNSGLTLVKQLKNKYKEKPTKTKILNNLQGLMTSKKGFFDSKIYSKYLYCTVDSELSLKIFEQQKQDKIFKEEIEKLVKKEPKKEINKKVDISTNKTETVPKTNSKVKNDINITFTGNNINSRYSNNKQSQKQDNTKKQEQFIPIKTYFEDEILEIGKILYVEMQNLERQKDAIKAWDKLEVLINKDVNDKKALTRMIDLLERINQNCDGIIIEYDKNKCMKLLEKKIEIKN